MMKVNQKKNEQTLQIPMDIQQYCGFADAQTLMMHATEDICVIHKGELTALELAHIIDALIELAGELTVQLAAVCGLCNNCSDEGPAVGCDGNPARWVADCGLCRALLDEGQNIHIPDYLLEEAGIPVGSKLEAYTDEESGEITVMEADIQQDINDVPSGVLGILAQSGICLAALDELIMREEIVYGG